jgi:hypothetical protein
MGPLSLSAPVFAPHQYCSRGFGLTRGEVD